MAADNILILKDKRYTDRINNQQQTVLTLRLLITTIVVLGGSANFKACQTYYIPHATIQSKCSHTGVNLLSYKHATFH